MTDTNNPQPPENTEDPAEQPVTPETGAEDAGAAPTDATEATEPPQTHYAPPQYLPPAPPAAPAPPQYSPAPGAQAPQHPQAPQAPHYSQQAPYPQQPGYPQQSPYGQPPYGQAPYVPAPYYGVPGPGGHFDGAQSPDDLSRPLYGATFGQSIQRFFKGYAKFSGRASRSEYWWVALFVFLIEIIPLFILLGGVIAAAISSSMRYEYDSYNSYTSGEPTGAALAFIIIGGLLVLLASLALIIPSLALGWRRFHDANFPGPLYLLTFVGAIPYVGWLANVAVIVLSLMPSKVEGRRFDHA